MPAELADNATHQDIQAYIDDVMQENKEDRAEKDKVSIHEDEPAPLREEKRDGQRIAEEHDETPIAEVKTSESAEEGDDTGESDDRSWFDDDVKAEVAAYGISEEELADFTSREELDRALRIFDKTALEAGRKALAEEEKPKEAEPARDEKGRYSKKDDQYEIKLPNKELYDEDLAKDLVEEFTNLRDHYESRLDAIEARFAEAEAKAEEERFDSIVDSLGHADLFGTTGKETPKQLERREDLIVAVKAQQIGLEQLGRPVDLDKSLVNRVARMVFAEDLSKKDLKAKTRRVQRQSNGRGGTGSTKSSGPEESLREWADRYYKELEGV